MKTWLGAEGVHAGAGKALRGAANEAPSFQAGLKCCRFGTATELKSRKKAQFFFPSRTRRFPFCQNVEREKQFRPAGITDTYPW